MVHQLCAHDAGLAPNSLEALRLVVDGENPRAGLKILGFANRVLSPQELLDTAIARMAKQLRPGAHLIGVWHALENLEGGSTDFV